MSRLEILFHERAVPLLVRVLAEREQVGKRDLAVLGVVGHTAIAKACNRLEEAGLVIVHRSPRGNVIQVNGEGSLRLLRELDALDTDDRVLPTLDREMTDDELARYARSIAKATPAAYIRVDESDDELEPLRRADAFAGEGVG